MNRDDILALLRKNPKLAEPKRLGGTHKIADAYLNQVGGGLKHCSIDFTLTVGADGSFGSSFAQSGC